MTRKMIIVVAAVLGIALVNAVVIGAVVSGYVSINLKKGVTSSGNANT